MCNFYIGQKVVYIGDDLSFDHSPGNTVHIIQAMRKAICGCGEIEIDVGKGVSGRTMECTNCWKITMREGVTYWKRSTWFRPLISDYTEAEIESVNIEEILEPLYEPAYK